MKKIYTFLLCMLSIPNVLIYPQNAKQIPYNAVNSSATITEEPNKVLIHLMGWYGEGNSGRHWGDGHVRTPLIGLYNSQSWSTLTYQMLLSWSCGIDGLVINLKDSYDSTTLEMLVSTINKLHDIDSINFKYYFSISYDDQGMGNLDTAEKKFAHLKDSILTKTRCFLKYHDTTAIFIFNYKDPNPYLSASAYNTALNAVFSTNKPKVIWNEIEAPEIANSYYPWVQGFAPDGAIWGKDYLEWYYNTISSTAGLDFATGGVWAGFNDTTCSWGQDRWIDRKNGAIFDSTWLFINDYTGNLPLKWVYIETWNDWNEGTEIEPSQEFGYKYLKSTINNINIFKETTIATDTSKFEAAKKIYEASASIESNRCDSIIYYPLLKRAIKHFFLNNTSGAISVADSIINRVQLPSGYFLKRCNWDDVALWSTNKPDTTVIFNFSKYQGQNNDGLRLDFTLPVQYSWVNISKNITFNTDTNPVTFLIKASASNQHSFLELKFTDDSGRVFRIMPNLSYFKEYWYRVVVYLENTTHAWGGPNNDSFGTISKFDIAISTDSASNGTVLLDEIGEGNSGLESSFYYEGHVMDPDSALPGIGFAQRRSILMDNEDPLVYEYLKALQEHSPNSSTVGSYEGDNSYHTFDNSLTAMAFIVKNDSLRAAKILDFYASRTDTNNTDVNSQNFFYRTSTQTPVQSRGFYQRANFITNKAVANKDRWMGDMAWLAMAYRHYMIKFCNKDYKKMITLIGDLLKSYYKPIDDTKGYIQSGWRNGDTKLHEKNGHPEGNIDCYAFFKNYDETLSLKIKTWIEDTLKGNNGLPLDLYSWRVLAYGQESENLLNIPEYDFRYRKELGDSIYGLFTGSSEFRNIWPEGTAHMATAYLNFGDSLRGNFYANQLDKLILTDTVNGEITHSLPYVVNNTGGFGGVDISIGSVSAAAWYIFAKNKFNPLFVLDTVQCITSITDDNSDEAIDIYPNPATDFIYVKSLSCYPFYVQIFDLQGKILLCKQITNRFENINISNLSNGLYLIKVIQDDNLYLKKIIIH